MKASRVDGPGAVVPENVGRGPGPFDHALQGDGLPLDAGGGRQGDYLHALGGHWRGGVSIIYF